MHTSERVDVYLSAAAKPVIEKCTGICFSEYPASSPVSADGPKNVSYQIDPLGDSYLCHLTRTEFVYDRNFESRTSLTSGKRRRQTGSSGMIGRSRLAIGLRNSGTAAGVLMSGIRRYLTTSWLVSAAKDLCEYPKGIISVTHHQTGLHKFEFIDSADRGQNANASGLGLHS